MQVEQIEQFIDTYMPWIQEQRMRALATAVNSGVANSHQDMAN